MGRARVAAASLADHNTRDQHMSCFRFVICWLVMSPVLFAAERPNILFIYTDDHSYRTVSCYEHAEAWAHTPHIDRLAARGVRFTHAYIGTWCMPSRITMLTGKHQYGATTMRMEGVYPGSEYDPAQCPFWPAVFRQQGYHTAQIGKWHAGRDARDLPRRARRRRQRSACRRARRKT